MGDAFSPVARQNLSDNLAYEIKRFIDQNDLRPGDKLPTITDMADRFDVGPPTLREALKKLETLGVVRIKHGSGIYVGDNLRALFLSNPVISQPPAKKLLLDLIKARMSIEENSARFAAANITDQQVERMADMLDELEKNLNNEEFLVPANMSFHCEIAEASGNTVIAQILKVLSELFQYEQQMILNIYGSRSKDHAEHRNIFEAIRRGDEAEAGERMRKHLEGVYERVKAWNPEDQPVT